jgi:anti-anti-sigma regulatory factor
VTPNAVSGPHAAEFSLRFRVAGPGVQIASAGGVVALAEARRLELGVLDGVRQGRTRVVVDLSEVTEVGPGLLGALLRIRRGLTRVGGRLALVVAGPPVSELVQTTVLAVLIDIAGDREEALARVSAGHGGGA